MELRHLATLVAVAEETSFTRAGRRLGLTQSAVSIHLRALETELGERLVDRGHRAVRLTPAGQLALRAARDVLERLADMRHAIADGTGLRRGSLRIGSGPTASSQLLPAILKRFTRRYPGMDLVVVGGTSRGVAEHVVSGTLDVGVVTLPVAHARVVAEVIDRDELVLVVPTQHPLARRRRVNAAALADQPLVLYQTGGVTRALIDQYLVRRHVRANVRMEIDHVDTIKQLVRAGLGASIIPARAVRREVKEGKLRAIRLGDEGLFREVGVISARDARRPAAVTAFVEVCRRFLAARPRASRPARG